MRRRSLMCVVWLQINVSYWSMYSCQWWTALLWLAKDKGLNNILFPLVHPSRFVAVVIIDIPYLTVMEYL